LYIAIEQPAWKRERNACLAKHNRLLMTALPNAHVHVEWSSGELWAPMSANNPEALLCRMQRDGTFKWEASGLALRGTSVEAIMQAAS
jgi:hypothetical protein